MNVFKTSCYSNLNDYHQEEEEHVGYQAMCTKLVSFIEKISTQQKITLLEFGAGTGLLTKHLANLPNVNLTVNEPDARCRAVLHENLNLNPCITEPFQDIASETSFDCILSSFAHDHIQNREDLTASLQRNLTPDGYYACGVELLREYKNPDDHMDALRDWHGYVIEQARATGNETLAFLETEALESGLQKVADFKVSKSVFEQSMIDAGFLLKESEITSPIAEAHRGGVYFYVWQKRSA